MDTLFNFWRILGILNVLDEVFCVDFSCFIISFKHEQCLIVFAENAIYIYTNKDFYFLNVS